MIFGDLTNLTITKQSKINKVFARLVLNGLFNEKTYKLTVEMLMKLSADQYKER